jgi:NAD(P)-dependent dehydrogenase (short-subunit alcohol dehydrogenase family)
MMHREKEAKMVHSLEGKVFVITGATSGIGLAVAESLVNQGAALIGIGRSAERCTKVQERLAALRSDGTPVKLCVADLGLQSEVRCLAKEIRAVLTGWKINHLDGLINNAATVPFWQTLTAEGFDTQWAVNHLAAFLLTTELLPLLKAAPQARVVTVSSASHYGARLNWEDIQLRKHYGALRAYGQTKLANILFTVELNRRLGKGSTIRAFAADPGLVNTELGTKSNSIIARWAWGLRKRSGITPEESAKGIVFLATEPSIQAEKDVFWRHSKPKAPSANALNAQAARQLWALSAQMCGIENVEDLSAQAV